MKKLLAILFFLPFIGYSQVSFLGNWESGTIIGDGNTNWDYVERVAEDRFAIHSTDVRQGVYCARVELRQGDNPYFPSSPGTERAEVSFMQNSDNSFIYENESSGVQRYSFSVKLDDTWQVITGSGCWGIIMQLAPPEEMTRGVNPTFALSVTDQFRLNVRAGDVTTSENIAHNLTDGSLNIGNWIDFILTIKYTKDNTGYFILQRRNEGVTEYTTVLNLQNVPTLKFDPLWNGGMAGNSYLKIGLYRNTQPFTSILYLDGFKREIPANLYKPIISGGNAWIKNGVPYLSK